MTQITMQIPSTSFRVIRLRGAGYSILLLAILALFPGCEKQPETSLSKDQMPPAKAFCSITLYDSKNGFLIPNAPEKDSAIEHPKNSLPRNCAAIDI